MLTSIFFLIYKKSPDGDLIDCIPIQDQPAFTNPLLKDHQLQVNLFTQNFFCFVLKTIKLTYVLFIISVNIIQETPTDMVRREEGYRLPIWQIWHRNGTACPHGTIPVRRIISYQNETTSSNAADRATQGHEVRV